MSQMPNIPELLEGLKALKLEQFDHAMIFQKSCEHQLSLEQLYSATKENLLQVDIPHQSVEAFLEARKKYLPLNGYKRGKRYRRKC